MNKRILEDEQQTAMTRNTVQIKNTEKIGNTSLDQLVIDLQRERLQPDLQRKIDDQTTFATLIGEHSVVLIHLLPYQEVYTLLQITTDHYSEETAFGIQIGDTKEEVLDAYGECEYEVILAQGTFLIYHQHKLIFMLDEEQTVKRWVVFRQSH